jgi:hypothetical protein
MKLQIKQSDLTQRNPVARSLADAQFRVRTVRDKTKYNRKDKHKNRLTA